MHVHMYKNNFIYCYNKIFEKNVIREGDNNSGWWDDLGEFPGSSFK